MCFEWLFAGKKTKLEADLEKNEAQLTRAKELLSEHDEVILNLKDEVAQIRGDSLKRVAQPRRSRTVNAQPRPINAGQLRRPRSPPPSYEHVNSPSTMVLSNSSTPSPTLYWIATAPQE
ncbi:Oidioi.mRNA.OKI2018_I69.XSR.g14670.t1.cds [Oikopleura dioica]|uniref:Oidioi.mRNA.OKI2018_I69.XSR.g14670.t1.cds n=1 Tax=Oikopleura dioica TaxID=34765 RepID=A0ABN7SEI8_OIKDI|nr:Oidioi.mRNA.OKI2018_I69.XSR.g14670.t1.cds [Oikopleura dioica]